MSLIRYSKFLSCFALLFLISLNALSISMFVNAQTTTATFEDDSFLSASDLVIGSLATGAIVANPDGALNAYDAQQTHWETIVSVGTTWKYILPNTQPSDSWKNQSFDTSSWLEGPSGIGYGDGDDATVIPQSISVYMRKELSLIHI